MQHFTSLDNLAGYIKIKQRENIPAENPFLILDNIFSY